METAPFPQIKTTYEQEQPLLLTRTSVRAIRCDQDCVRPLFFHRCVQDAEFHSQGKGKQVPKSSRDPSPIRIPTLDGIKREDSLKLTSFCDRASFHSSHKQRT